MKKKDIPAKVGGSYREKDDCESLKMVQPCSVKTGGCAGKKEK